MVRMSDLVRGITRETPPLERTAPRPAAPPKSPAARGAEPPAPPSPPPPPPPRPAAPEPTPPPLPAAMPPPQGPGEDPQRLFGELQEQLVEIRFTAEDRGTRVELTHSGWEKLGDAAASLRERYDREKERYRLPERARLREIVILRPENAAQIDAARQRANQIAARAKTEDFAKLALEASEAGTKSKGGDLGEVARGELLPDLDKAVFNSPAGTVIGPLESKSAWHILKVETRLPSEVPAFESVKDKLRKDASDDAWQRDYKAYIDRLRKDAFIQIHEENVPAS